MAGRISKCKITPAVPKQEWRYINFVQNFLIRFATSNREEINEAWNIARQEQKLKVYEILNTLIQFTNNGR